MLHPEHFDLFLAGEAPLGDPCFHPPGERLRLSSLAPSFLFLALPFYSNPMTIQITF